MKTLHCLAVATVATFASVTTVIAAEAFDGSKPFTCAPVQAHDCLPDQKECKLLEPPKDKPDYVFKFDIGKKTVWSPFRNGEPLPIQHVTKNTASLVLQGTTLEVAWSSTIHRKTGRLTITIADREGAYVVFGQCTAS
jgi:hypothetical protein